MATEPGNKFCLSPQEIRRRAAIQPDEWIVLGDDDECEGFETEGEARQYAKRFHDPVVFGKPEPYDLGIQWNAARQEWETADWMVEKLRQEYNDDLSLPA